MRALLGAAGRALLSESASAGVSSRISDMVAPSVIFSAAGLLNLAFSNRLAAIVARLRQFDAEQAKLVIEYYQNAAPGKENIQMLLGERIAQIDRQLGLIFKRARLARSSVMYTMACIYCMLICIAFIGLAAFAGGFAYLAAVTFALGGVTLAIALSYNMIELSTALNPVEYEVSQVGGHYVHSRRGNGNGNAGGPVGRDGRGLSAIVGSVVDRLNIAHALEDKEALEAAFGGNQPGINRVQSGFHAWSRLSGREALSDGLHSDSQGQHNPLGPMAA